MLNAIIRFSLHNRVLVLAAAVLMSAYGLFTVAQLPTDVLPDLNRPRVTVMTEAPGLAPEEVEVQVTFHLETALNGAVGVERVRSSTGLGLSIVFVEFGWDTDLRYDRQVVQERLNQVIEKLPPGVIPIMGPVTSIMGEIMLLGLRSDTLSPMEVRSLADWTIRPTLLAVTGVGQITVMGGELRQFQVLVDPDKLRRHDLTFAELEEVLERANENSGGGFFVEGGQELSTQARDEHNPQDHQSESGAHHGIGTGQAPAIDPACETLGDPQCKPILFVLHSFHFGQ